MYVRACVGSFHDLCIRLAAVLLYLIGNAQIHRCPTPPLRALQMRTPAVRPLGAMASRSSLRLTLIGADGFFSNFAIAALAAAVRGFSSSESDSPSLELVEAMIAVLKVISPRVRLPRSAFVFDRRRGPAGLLAWRAVFV
jgi:hypothetical protein